MSDKGETPRTGKAEQPAPCPLPVILRARHRQFGVLMHLMRTLGIGVEHGNANGGGEGDILIAKIHRRSNGSAHSICKCGNPLWLLFR